MVSGRHHLAMPTPYEQSAQKLREACRAQDSFHIRYRTALFVANFRGHRIDVPRMIELSWGVSASCPNCEMCVKVPRALKPGEEGVVGRAIEFDCPAAGPNWKGT